MRDFPAAGGMADQRRVLDIERIQDGREVVGIMIHVVAVPRLVGPAMAAPVMSDHPEAAACQKEHLAVPGIRGQRPAVGEHDRSAGPPNP